MYVDDGCGQSSSPSSYVLKGIEQCQHISTGTAIIIAKRAYLLLLEWWRIWRRPYRNRSSRRSARDVIKHHHNVAVPHAGVSRKRSRRLSRYAAYAATRLHLHPPHTPHRSPLYRPTGPDNQNQHRGESLRRVNTGVFKVLCTINVPPTPTTILTGSRQHGVSRWHASPNLYPGEILLPYRPKMKSSSAWGGTRCPSTLHLPRDPNSSQTLYTVVRDSVL